MVGDGENVLLGTGHSSCCNLERSKVRNGFGDALHYCDLIAKKRSLINVIISITGISDEFTQDEDILKAQFLLYLVELKLLCEDLLIMITGLTN